MNGTTSKVIFLPTTLYSEYTTFLGLSQDHGITGGARKNVRKKGNKECMSTQGGDVKRSRQNVEVERKGKIILNGAQDFGRMKRREKRETSSLAVVDNASNTQRILLPAPTSLHLSPRTWGRRTPQRRKLNWPARAARWTSWRVLTRTRSRRRVRVSRIRLSPRIGTMRRRGLVLRLHRHRPTRRMELCARKRCTTGGIGIPRRAGVYASSCSAGCRCRRACTWCRVPFNSDAAEHDRRW